MFKLLGSPQKNAAPMQSFIKGGGAAFGQQTPNANLSQMNPFTPRPSQGGWKSPMQKGLNMPFLEPVFMSLLAKHFGE